jgi:hypothetical protein
VQLPAAVRNPISTIGMAIATATAMVFLALLVAEWLGIITNPYSGLVTFIAVPTAFAIGLLLIPIGARWSARRQRRHPGAADWPVIDLRDSRQRTILFTVLGLTFANVVILSSAAFGGMHYMERREFCGQVCHTTMEPEFVAQEAWPHAKLACVSCHVGPGVGSLVESKLAGTRQLWHLTTGQIPRPIPTPVRSLGDTGTTCEQCHRRERDVSDLIRVIRDFASDETNSESVTTMALHVGTADSQGIHRHVGLDIEYIATDGSRAEIPFVRVRDEAGAVREYTAEGATPSTIAAGVARKMDCTDCHNRPAHTFFFTAERAVDTAIAAGRVPRELPFVRREAVAAVSGEYDDAAAARDAIASRLTGLYTSRGLDQRLVTRAVAGVQDVWARNVFPAMKVTWGTYPNHLGHVDTPGCFRCHDDSHQTPDGKVISQSCELCHALE